MMIFESLSSRIICNENINNENQYRMGVAQQQSYLKEIILSLYAN